MSNGTYIPYLGGFFNSLLQKANLSGATFSGNVSAPFISATTISAGTLYSGTTPLETIIYNISYLSITAGEMYMIGNTIPTIITSTTTYFKASGNTESGTLYNFTHPLITNRLVYSGTGPTLVNIYVECSISSSSSNQTLRGIIAINGSGQTKTEGEIRTSIGNQTVPNSHQGSFLLSPGDYVEFFVRNISGTNDIIVEYINMIIIHS